VAGVAFPAKRTWRTWYARHPHRPDAALRLFLRDAALESNTRESDAAPLPAELVERLGPRRCAEIVFEEGELLGLRLPDAARALLRRAADLYSFGADRFGGFTSDTLAALLLAPPDFGQELSSGLPSDRAAFMNQTARARA